MVASGTGYRMGSFTGVSDTDSAWSSLFADGEIGGDRGGSGPGYLRTSDVVDLAIVDCANDSNGVSSGGDMRLLMSKGFFDSAALFDESIDAIVDLCRRELLDVEKVKSIENGRRRMVSDCVRRRCRPVCKRWLSLICGASDGTVANQAEACRVRSVESIG